jgi:hypothetical protein
MPAAPPQPPAYQQPAPPAAPPQPPAAAAPPLPKLWVVVNGQPVLQEPAQYMNLPPATQVHREDGIGGWQPLSKILPAAPAPAAAPPLNRTAYAPPAGPTQLPQPVGGAPDPSLFAGMESAQISRRGAFLTAGDYILKLSSAEFKNLRKGGMAAICEWIVMVSSYRQDNPTTHGCITEGSGVTTFIKKNDSFNGNMKELILALSGFDKSGQPRPETDQVTAQEVSRMLSPEQPFTGQCIYVEARDRELKDKPGQFYTNLNYWPMPMKPDGVGGTTWDFDRLAREIR